MTCLQVSEACQSYRDGAGLSHPPDDSSGSATLVSLCSFVCYLHVVSSLHRFQPEHLDFRHAWSLLTGSPFLSLSLYPSSSRQDELGSFCSAVCFISFLFRSLFLSLLLLRLGPWKFAPLSPSTFSSPFVLALLRPLPPFLLLISQANGWQKANVTCLAPDTKCKMKACYVVQSRSHLPHAQCALRSATSCKKPSAHRAKHKHAYQSRGPPVTSESWLQDKDSEALLNPIRPWMLLSAKF